MNLILSEANISNFGPTFPSRKSCKIHACKKEWFTAANYNSLWWVRFSLEKRENAAVKFRRKSFQNINEEEKTHTSTQKHKRGNQKLPSCIEFDINCRAPSNVLCSLMFSVVVARWENFDISAWTFWRIDLIPCATCGLEVVHFHSKQSFIWGKVGGKANHSPPTSLFRLVKSCLKCEINLL